MAATLITADSSYGEWLDGVRLRCSTGCALQKESALSTSWWGVLDLRALARDKAVARSYCGVQAVDCEATGVIECGFLAGWACSGEPSEARFF